MAKEPVHPRRAGNTSSIRFIPARAGNTTISSVPRSRGEQCRPVHPRPRGEHVAYATNDGSARRVNNRLAAHRFIPARAGNTRRRLPRRVTWVQPARGTDHVRASPVHPRPRGEHEVHVSDVVVIPGAGSARLRHRFIPARAGNTTTIGASARVGHIPGAGNRRLAWRRFIPARAGNTLPTTL